MALPVRPQVWPPAPGNVQPGRNDARVAAQKAFFEAALAGKTSGQTAQATQTAQAAQAAARPEPPKIAAAQAVRSVAAAEARATDRLPPPGSIINILV